MIQGAEAELAATVAAVGLASEKAATAKGNLGAATGHADDAEDERKPVEGAAAAVLAMTGGGTAGPAADLGDIDDERQDDDDDDDDDDDESDGEEDEEEEEGEATLESLMRPSRAPMAMGDEGPMPL